MRNNILFALIATFSLLFMGCSASYQQGFLQKSNHQYSPTRILLITPENGTYGDIVYPTSGNDVITALTQELNRYSPQSISTTYNPIDVQNLPDSDLANFDYIFAPKILVLQAGPHRSPVLYIRQPEEPHRHLQHQREKRLRCLGQQAA